MVQKVIWSNLAIRTYLDNISYLQQEWTQKEIDNFIEATERKLELLKYQPNKGALTNKRLHTRKTLIIKRILLIYRYKSRKNEIELLRFFNTWQHPGKMKQTK
jgi:plasmid stabilization system protein ParE